MFGKTDPQEAMIKQQVNDYERSRLMDQLKEDYTQSQIYDALEAENDDLLSTTLDNSRIITELENALRGRIQVKNPKGGGFVWKQICDPVMNEEGIQSVLQVVVTKIGKNVILANIDSEDLERVMIRIHKNLVILFATNTRRFGIDKGRRTTVLWDVSMLVYFSLTRAVGAAERKDVYGRTKAIEHLQRSERGEAIDKKRWGIFGNGS